MRKFIVVPLILFLVACTNVGDLFSDNGGHGGSVTSHSHSAASTSGKGASGTGGGSTSDTATASATSTSAASSTATASSSSSGCLNTTFDSHNCGQCGHDCLGATCSGGFCTPTYIATNQSYPRALVVDATTAYWTTSANEVYLNRAPKDGSGTPAVLANLLMAGDALAVDATYVYTSGSKTRLSDGTTTPFASSVAAWANGIAVDGQNIFWTAYGLDVIASIPIDASTPLTALASAPNQPFGIAADANFLYWSAYGSGGNSGYVSKVNKSGGVAVQLAAGAWGATDIAVDGTHVYWPTPTGFVMRVPVNGGTTELFAHTAQPARVALDATYVYWTDDDESSIYRQPKDMSSPPLMLFTTGSNLYSAWAIALDTQYVYWTVLGHQPSNSDGFVARMAK